jgi:hypothetical protein
MLALPVHSFPLRPRNEAAWRLLSLRVDSRFRTGGPKVASSNLAAPTLMAIHGTVSSALTVAGAIAVAAWVADQTLNDVREILKRRVRQPSNSRPERSASPRLP